MNVREQLVEALVATASEAHDWIADQAGVGASTFRDCRHSVCAQARAAIERAKRETCCVDTWNDWKPPMVDRTVPGRIVVKRPLPRKI